MRGGTAALDARTLRVVATPTEVSFADASGASRVVHQFAPSRLCCATAGGGSRSTMS